MGGHGNFDKVKGVRDLLKRTLDSEEFKDYRASIKASVKNLEKIFRNKPVAVQWELLPSLDRRDGTYMPPAIVSASGRVNQDEIELQEGEGGVWGRTNKIADDAGREEKAKFEVKLRF